MPHNKDSNNITVPKKASDNANVLTLSRPLPGFLKGSADQFAYLSLTDAILPYYRSLQGSLESARIVPFIND